MFNDEGKLVPAERPMIESAICDYRDNSPRFRFYLDYAELKAEGGKVEDVKPRVIELSVEERLKVRQS